MPLGDAMQIVRLIPKLDQPCPELIINFNLNDKIITELKIIVGELPRAYQENEDLDELLKICETKCYQSLCTKFTDITNQCYFDHYFYYNTNINSTDPKPKSLQDMLVKDGQEISKF